MAKINLDKYYTPSDIVDFCLNEVKKIMIEDGVKPSRVIEPSAGNGSFSKKIKGCFAYDIEPEDDSITKADFLTLDLDYVKGTLVIGNPPFGEKFNLGVKFFKKSVEISDYIGFILPIRQLNNTNVLYEFDLIKSFDLGKRNYSGKEIHCCFNIYRRPKNNVLNKKTSTKLKCVTIVRNDSKRFENFEYDIRMCNWGNGSGGKLLKDDENASSVYKIKIHEDFRDEVIKVLKNVEWHKETNNVAMLKIQQYHIIEVLKREIPNIY